MKKIIGAVIVGLCTISFDATCMYKPLGEQKGVANDAEKPSRPHHETIDDIVAGIKAACSPEDFARITQWAIDDLAEQEREEEEKRKREEKFKEFVDHLRAQQRQRDHSPRTPTAIAH